MRGRTFARAVFPVLLCLVVFLWLAWGFLAWPVSGKSVLTLLSLLVASVVTRRRYLRRQPVQRTGDKEGFPPESHTGPVVMVCPPERPQ